MNHRSNSRNVTRRDGTPARAGFCPTLHDEEKNHCAPSRGESDVNRIACRSAFICFSITAISTVARRFSCQGRSFLADTQNSSRCSYAARDRPDSASEYRNTRSNEFDDRAGMSEHVAAVDSGRFLFSMRRFSATTFATLRAMHGFSASVSFPAFFPAVSFLIPLPFNANPSLIPD